MLVIVIVTVIVIAIVIVITALSFTPIALARCNPLDICTFCTSKASKQHTLSTSKASNSRDATLLAKY